MLGTQTYGPVTITMHQAPDGSDFAAVHVANADVELEAALTGASVEALQDAWDGTLSAAWDQAMFNLAVLGFTELDDDNTVVDPTGITHLMYPTDEGADMPHKDRTPRIVRRENDKVTILVIPERSQRTSGTT